MADTTETQSYVVKRDGFILGTWRNHNSHVDLTPEQAEAFLRDGSLAERDLAQPKAKAST